MPDDYSDVTDLDFGDPDEPWILPSKVPGGWQPTPQPPPAGGIPPGGVEPEAGDSCESLNMDPMAPTDPAVEAAKWGGIYKHGKWPWCVTKSAQPQPRPRLPQDGPRLPQNGEPPAAVDSFCRGQKYVPETEANKRALYVGAAGAAGGLLLGVLIGYVVGS